MDVLISIVWVMFALYLLYGTNMAYAYLSRMPILDRWTHIKQYKQFHRLAIPYSTFMESDHPSFLVNLFSCRYCLGVWLSLIPSALIGWDWLPMIYFGSQLGCSAFMWIQNWFANYDTDIEF